MYICLYNVQYIYMYMYVPVSIGKILWTCLSLHMHVLVLHEFSILKKVDFVCENYSIQSVGPIIVV